MCTGRTLGQLPFVAEEVLKEVVAPFRRRGRPGNFQAAGDRVAAFSAAKCARPTDALRGNRCTCGFHTLIALSGGTVSFAKAVSAGDQCDGFFVIHCHAAKRLANVTCRSNRIWVPVRALRINVNESHLNGAERILEFAVTCVTLVIEPYVFGAPIDLFLRLPDVRTSAAKPKRLKAHRLESAVAGKDYQVGPRELSAVFLFYRPDQKAGLVEVYIVRPTVERCKTLHTRSTATAAVRDAIRARGVPCHANKERPVVAKICRPPILRIGHYVKDVTLYGREVEGVELLGIVKALAHRIGQRGVLAKDAQTQHTRPPVTVRPVCAGGAFDRSARERASI